METKTRNPLRDMPIRTIGDWPEWKKLFFERMAPKEPWKEREYHFQEDLTGLLFCGFDVRTRSREEWAERICLYLDLANGYKSCRFGRSVSQAEPCEPVICKAWKVLALTLFRKPEKEHETVPWINAICDATVFRKLLWFFCDEHNIPSSFDQSHEDKLALDFLERFTRFVLTFKYFGEYAGDSDRALQEMFRAARSQIFKLMARLCTINFLLSQEVSLDDSDLEILEGMAREHEIYLPVLNRRGRCKTVEEASSAGSGAASVAILLRVRLVEKKRQEAIRKAEQDRREADQRLATLQGNKKEA